MFQLGNSQLFTWKFPPQWESSSTNKQHRCCFLLEIEICMSVRNSRVDAPTGSKRMTTGSVISYSFGDMANNFTFMATSMFLMIYMTNIAGLSAGVAGAIYGVTKIWAGVTDLVAGQVVDRFETRWGRLRHWLLFCSTPLALVFVLLFSTPDMSMNVKIAWILIFDALYQLFYSFTNIPYGSLSAAMTQDPVDRSRLSGARSIAASLAAVLLSFLVAPQFRSAAETAGKGGDLGPVRLTFTLLCVGLAVVAVILYLICFKNAKEVVERPSTKVTMKDTFRTIGKNKPLLTLCVGAFFLLCSMFSWMAVSAYYVTFVLGNPLWLGYLSIAQTLGTIAIASFVPAISQKLGKRFGYICCAIVVICSFVIMYFAPGHNLIIALFAWFVYGVGTGGTNALMFSMQADTVDYGEWKTGFRSEGGSYSVLSFIRKCGQGLGGWAAGVIIGLYGYKGDAKEQTVEALTGLRVATGLVPAGIAAVALIVMLAYNLDAKRHAEIVRELNERRTNVVVKDLAHGEEIKVKEIGDGRTVALRQKGQAAPPIITIFGTSGAGASIIGPMLASKLNVPYVGQKFSSEQLALTDRSELMSDTGFDRWLRSVDYVGAADSAMAQAYDGSTNNMIAAKNTKEILDKVKDGAVVLGRNGAYVLHHVVGVLHVRLIAPKPKRIERVMHRTGLTMDQATNQLEAEDRMRAEMSIHLYQWNPNNENYYDLVVNTGSITYEQVVDTIIDLYRSKYPENEPDPTVETGEIYIPRLRKEAQGEGKENDIRK